MRLARWIAVNEFYTAFGQMRNFCLFGLIDRVGTISVFSIGIIGFGIGGGIFRIGWRIDQDKIVVRIIIGHIKNNRVSSVHDNIG